MGADPEYITRREAEALVQRAVDAVCAEVNRALNALQDGEATFRRDVVRALQVPPSSVKKIERDAAGEIVSIVEYGRAG